MKSVYVIAGSDTGPFKVGISDDVEKRIATLQVGSAIPLHVVYVLRDRDDARDVEALTHELLAAARMKGEWFRAEKDVVIGAIIRAAERMDNWRAATTFLAWVRTQANRRDAIGDLARDAIRDSASLARMASYYDLTSRMRSVGASTEALDAADAAFAEFRKATAP